jgi:hypothetical protein
MALRALALLATALVLAGCGGIAAAKDSTKKRPVALRVGKTRTCAPGLRRLGSPSLAYAGVVRVPLRAYRRPGGRAIARFGLRNVNGVPTVFGVVGAQVGRTCRARWYRVQLPMRPNGATGFVRARDLWVSKVRTRIEVDVSARRLTFFRGGREVLSARVAVGSPATPTPIGRFYVNQRLIPTDKSGPFGPGAIGISAFSNVLTGWVQGGPVAIHGTNEPWSIGHAVSNGCIRLPNAVLLRIFRATPAGTPVVVHP